MNSISGKRILRYFELKNANECLEDSINTALLLQLFTETVFKLKIFKFTFDAPVNTIIKSIKIYDEYESCRKCVVYEK